MKSVVLSGVFVLASAGLAIAASARVEPAPEDKPAAAVLVSAGEVDALIRGKKEDQPAAVAVAAPVCDGTDDPAICAEAARKE
jgi:hypothetical protein